MIGLKEECVNIARLALGFEEHAALVRDEQRSAWLTMKYQKLNLSPIAKWFRLKDNVQRVVVKGRSKSPLFDRAYPINRLLLLILLNDKRAEYVCVNREEGKVAENSSNEMFDHAIVRHGIKLSFEQQFPDLSRAVKRQMKTWGKLRLSRRPLWSSPTALALEQELTESAMQCQPPRLSRCYSDILDPWVQYQFRHLMVDEAQFLAFYTGRLRLLSLLHDEILVNATQVIDGCFFHLLLDGGGNRLERLADECRMRFIHRDLTGLLKFSRGDAARRDWREKWLYEPWKRRHGLAKPNYFFSLGRDLGLRLYEALRKQNASAKPVADAVANAEEHLHRLNASMREQAVFGQIKRADFWLSHHRQRSGDASGQFRISDFYDPGWFYSQLRVPGQKYLSDNARVLIPARRPRQANIAAMATTKLPSQDQAKLEAWLYYAYHAEISRAEKTGAWETVCTLACEWSRWLAPESSIATTGCGISITALGGIESATWSNLARRCRDRVKDWYLGRATNLDAVWKILASECPPGNKGRTTVSNMPKGDPHKWRRRIEQWSHGNYSIEMRALPIRSKIDELSPTFIIVERGSATRTPLAVTQFRGN
jgi:hypothetical protein